MHTFTISGRYIDIFRRRTYPAIITIADGKIAAVEETQEAALQYILPGFIDAHVHIESSMLTPTAFARIAVTHGTVATVSDPHEIANVCGVAGVEYMIANSKQTPFKFFFGAPSCVPATFFETAGAHIDAKTTGKLMKNPDIWYLAEMMNYPGVLNKDPEVMAKIDAAKQSGKPVDGHAPGLKGEQAIAYAAAGITTDHECFTLEEALDKIAAGMNIIIREGSAAKNFEALHPLFNTHPRSLMFCSDDKHPDELVFHHINGLVKRALAKGYDLYDVLYAACIKPAEHYNIPVGLLRVNDPADIIVIDNPQDFNILQTYIDGSVVAENGRTLLPHTTAAPINNFNTRYKYPADLVVQANGPDAMLNVIEALEGQLITNCIEMPAKIENGTVVSDTENDVLKVVVVNRYNAEAAPAIAFIKNFELNAGAIASTVAHDCHNIIAVGVDDISLCNAINALIDAKGGISVSGIDGAVHCMPLPIAGLMTGDDGYDVARQYSRLDAQAKALGTSLKAPFMTLSFMALLVIPSLKLSDKGLFDGDKFEFASVQK